MARLTRLTIALVSAVVIGWVLFVASLQVFGPSGAFCFDPDGTKPPSTGCVHVSVDPITGRGISNHETTRTDAAGVTTWYHLHAAVTGPIAVPMFVTVPTLTALIFLVLEAVARGAAAAPSAGVHAGGGAAQGGRSAGTPAARPSNADEGSTPKEL